MSVCCKFIRPVVPLGAGDLMARHPQILADQLTLSQLGGTDYAYNITTGTPGFSDLPRALHKVDTNLIVSKHSLFKLTSLTILKS